MWTEPCSWCSPENKHQSLHLLQDSGFRICLLGAIQALHNDFYLVICLDTRSYHKFILCSCSLRDWSLSACHIIDGLPHGGQVTISVTIIGNTKKAKYYCKLAVWLIVCLVTWQIVL